MRVLAWILGVFLLLALAAAGLFAWAVQQYRAPGPLAAERNILIPRGYGVQEIAEQLEVEKVVSSRWLVLAGVRFTEGRPLRAGEYAFPAGISAEGVVELLRSGRTVVRRLTVAEGLTSAQVVALIQAEPALSGEMGSVPGEGTLLPDTYHFSWGDSRQSVVERMQKAMRDAVAELWAKRAEGLPLERPEQAVVLASIVEKETGVAAERARVAGVFANRLRRNMRLQSDPTVVYGLTNGQGALGRPLTRADWRHASPFNTYQIDGLPPKPIANPGRASLAAAMDPERHDYLYFVADGSGGHAFARTLAEHNRNVARWRQVQRERGEPADAVAAEE
ncbi:MAG TPA: endolytic transglycosylase MltG [Azospirillaceae bacterium]|nr:endolytic transglycosylase MltG [Azospirillaceae bacterium]